MSVFIKLDAALHDDLGGDVSPTDHVVQCHGCCGQTFSCLDCSVVPDSIGFVDARTEPNKLIAQEHDPSIYRVEHEVDRLAWRLDHALEKIFTVLSSANHYATQRGRIRLTGWSTVVPTDQLRILFGLLNHLVFLLAGCHKISKHFSVHALFGTRHNFVEYIMDHKAIVKAKDIFHLLEHLAHCFFESVPWNPKSLSHELLCVNSPIL